MSARILASARAGARLGEDPDRLYTIGELADEFQVTTRTIRFYEAKGLIAPARRGVARCYSRRDRARLKLILRGKNLGFSLEKIAEYLKLYDADPAQIAQTRMLLSGVEAAIENLQGQRADLDRTLRELKDIRGHCIEHLRAKGIVEATRPARIGAPKPRRKKSDWDAFSSRSIAAIRHSPADEVLDVKFVTGRIYRYFGVDETTVESFRAASSKGAFFNDHIRGAYPFEQLA